ncbi:MAG: PspC domain-containing protein [Anaerolineae bacterium]
MEKQLQRSRTNRVIAGVCGGLGQYLNLDPVLLRVLAVILAFISGGTMILVYLALALIMPLQAE